ncbi:MAG: SLBB domain-containing protein [Candidatus Acidiferrum sp.]
MSKMHGYPLRRGSMFLLALFLSFGLGIAAQELPPQNQPQVPRRTGSTTDIPPTHRPAQSDLVIENYEHVAASAAQVKEVLIQDPGLMVELKHWVAKEAGDNGQVVNDQDLSDQAIFDRLTNDVKFRSLATQLLQRYGYFKPQFNPLSDEAKEQDLVLKERARKLVEIEAQQDALALDEQKEARKAEREAAEKRINCRPGSLLESQDENYNQLIDCRDLEMMQRQQNPLQPGTNQMINPMENLPLPSIPDLGVPATSGSSIMRAQANPMDQLGGTDNMGGFAGGGSSTDSSSLMNMSMRNSGMGLSGGGLQMPGSEVGSLEALQGGALQGGLGGNPAAGNYSMAGALPETMQPGPMRNVVPRYPKERYVAPDTVVHRPSPYADVPSMYDLYVQAPSRTSKPERFGGQVFRDGIRDPRAIPLDVPVGPDYVVGPGDTLSIDLWGGVTTRFVRAVDRQGRISLPDAGPVQVNGKSLGEVQELVQKAVASQYRDTSADVSVGRMRTVRVYMVGEVSEPGAYDISSLSTPLNAVVAADGVTPRGSLRMLKHYRGKELLEEVDCYDLLLYGVTPNAQKLENGDTLMVPPIGPQVTITGMVRRPAIYELRDEKTLADVLSLAGGILPAATLKHVEVQRLDAHEKRTMLSLDLSAEDTDGAKLSAFKVQDGDEIHIFPIAPYNQDAIYLQGHVLRPGRYSYREGMKVTDIIGSYKDLLPEPAPHYGEIVRLNAPDFHPSVESFDLAAALANPEAAPKLEPLDTVRVFSRFDFEPAPTVWVGGEVRAPGKYTTSGQAHLRDAVYLAGGLTPEADLADAQLFRIEADGTSKIMSVNLKSALAGSPLDDILLRPRDRLLIHRNTDSVERATVDVTGEVVKPGRYPWTSNMRVEDLIRAAGGLKRSADTTHADLTRYAMNGKPGQIMEVSLASLSNGNASEDVPLNRGDVLTIRQVPGWKDIGAVVTVKGEVEHPGTFGIEPGEKLSSLLARAGGYTPQAFPYGALLTRREVREEQEIAHAELVRRVQSMQAGLRTMPDGDENQKNAKLTALAQSESTLAQLRLAPPVGRVVIHIQGPVDKWKNTGADIAMRDGDELVIPKRVGYVMVNGQVYNPTAVSFRSGTSARWYLSQAGGFTPLADSKGIFVVRADGSVLGGEGNKKSWFSGDPLSAALQPGDTVVVPEKAPNLVRKDYTQLLQIASVASSVAIAIAYIHP